MAEEEHLWELNKENIKPLRQGRAQAPLQMALDTSQHTKLKLKKQEYEMKLRSYSGDDPLSIWYEYVLWSEQSFPKGGKEQNLQELIESCMHCIQTKTGFEKYRDDQRFFALWVKFANVCPGPLEVYRNLFAHNLCTGFAELYENWATLMEANGNYKNADKIYQKGIDKGAQPLQQLRSAHRGLQLRAAKRAMDKAAQEEQEEGEEEEEEGRKALNNLAAKGTKKKVVPISRVGEAVLGSAGVLPAQSTQNHNHATQPFTIYTDQEDASTAAVSEACAPQKMVSIPCDSKSVKENRRDAGRWKHQKIGSKISIPISEVDGVDTLKFKVYKDEDDGGAHKPGHYSYIDRVLCARKQDDGWRVPMFVAEPPDPHKKPMYPKHLVYGGPEELSPEQLMAMRYFQREEEESRACQEEPSDKYHCMAEELEDLKRRMNHVVTENHQLKQQLIGRKDESAVGSTHKAPPKSIYCDSFVCINKSVNVTANETEMPSMLQTIEDPKVNVSALPAEVSRQGCDATKWKASECSVAASPPPNAHTQDKAIQRFLQNSLFDESVAAPNMPHEDLSSGVSGTEKPFSIYCDQNEPKGTKSPPPSGQAKEDSTADQSGDGMACLPQSKSFSKMIGLHGTITDESIVERSNPFQIHEDEPLPAAPPSVPFTIYGDPTCQGLPVSASQEADPPLTAFNKDPKDVAQGDPENIGRAAPLPERSPAMPLPVKEVQGDQTIILPSDRDDFFKQMKTLASTPNPSSVGLVPQRNCDDDFTMKLPLSKKKVQRSDDGLKRAETKGQAFLARLSRVAEVTKPSDGSTLDGVASSSCEVQAESAADKVAELDEMAKRLWDQDVQDSPNASLGQCSFGEGVGANLVPDPFDEDLRQQLLSKLHVAVHTRPGYKRIHANLPKIKDHTPISLDGTNYEVLSQKGCGAYAQVYHATTMDSMNVTLCPSASTSSLESHMILKIQRPCSHWEFYICHELRERLKRQANAQSYLHGLMRINRAYFFPTGSILATEYHQYGTILDLVNAYKNHGKTIPMHISMYLVLELMCLVQKMHQCGIIHADLKPDNVLLRHVPQQDFWVPRDPAHDGSRLLKLIDFGRSIDMALLPRNTAFTKKVTTRNMTCCEMKEGLPWAYQTDYFGIAAIAHCLLWGSYMQVHKVSQSWHVKCVTFQRSWPSVWKDSIFKELLNAPPASQQLDLAALRKPLVQAYCDIVGSSSVADNKFFYSLHS